MSSRRLLLARSAVLAWTAIMAFICIRAFFFPHIHSVSYLYAQAGRNWLQGLDTYPQMDRGYRYSPAATALFIPFGFMSDGIGGALWRLINCGVLLGGFAWWWRAVGRNSFRAGRHASPEISMPSGLPSWDPVPWLLLIPLSLGSLNNGQANPLLAGLMLAAVAAAHEERWNISVMCLVLAVVLKAYPLALGLVLVLILPWRFGVRLLLALAAGFAFPFLCQDAAYVSDQYRQWFECLLADQRINGALVGGYRDLWLLLKLADVPITAGGYRMLQLALAAGVAGLCLAARHTGCTRAQLLTIVTTQAICWMILCGPATENCTYILLAPVLLWATIDGWRSDRSVWSRRLLILVNAVNVLHVLLGVTHTARLVLWQLLPIAALPLFGYLVAIQIRWLAEAYQQKVAAPRWQESAL